MLNTVARILLLWFLLSESALAAGYTLGQVVGAHQQGLPTAVILRMIEGVEFEPTEAEVERTEPGEAGVVAVYITSVESEAAMTGNLSKLIDLQA